MSGHYNMGHLEAVAEFAYQVGLYEGRGDYKPFDEDGRRMEKNHTLIHNALGFEEVIWRQQDKEIPGEFFDLIDNFIEDFLSRHNGHVYCTRCNTEMVVRPGIDDCLNCGNTILEDAHHIKDELLKGTDGDMTPRIIQINREILEFDFVKEKNSEDIFQKGYVESKLSNDKYYVVFLDNNDNCMGYEMSGEEIELMADSEIECFLEDIKYQNEFSLFQSRLKYLVAEYKPIIRGKLD